MPELANSNVDVALRVGAKPIAAENIVVIRPTTERSNLNKAVLDIASAMFQGIENNLYASISSNSHIDKTFDHTLTNLAGSFDSILGRIPMSIASKRNVALSFFNGIASNRVQSSVPMPTDLFMKLSWKGRNSAEVAEYYVVGIVAALEGLAFCADMINKSSAGGSVKDLYASLSKYSDGYFFSEVLAGIDKAVNFSADRADATGMFSSIYSYDHARTVCTMVASVIELHVNSNDAAKSTYSSLSSDILTAVVSYAKTLLERLAAIDKTDQVVAFLETVSYINLLVQEKEGGEKTIVEFDSMVVGLLNGSLYPYSIDSYDYRNDNTVIKVLEGDLNFQYEDEQMSKMIDEIKGKTGDSSFFDGIKDLKIQDSKVTAFIAHLVDLYASLQRTSPMDVQKSFSLSKHVTNMNALVNSYGALLTSLLGADENTAKSAMADFLTSNSWLNSYASTLYGLAVSGYSTRASDVATMLNLYTIGKDGVSASLKARHLNITIHKDPITFVSNKQLANAVVDYKIDDSFGLDSLQSQDISNGKQNANKGENGLAEQIISTLAGKGTDVLSLHVDEIISTYNGVVDFIKTGSLNSISARIDRIASEILPYLLVNTACDPYVLQSVGRNAGLIVGSSYTISADAKKAVLDRLGIVDAAISSHAGVINKAIIMAAKVVMSYHMDAIKSMHSVLVNKNLVQSKTGFVMNVTDADSMEFERLCVKLEDMCAELLGERLSARGTTWAESSDTTDSIDIEGIGGVDNSAYDIIRNFNASFDRFDTDVLLKTNSRKLLFSSEKFKAVKIAKDTSIRIGGKVYAVVWNDAARSHDMMSNVESVQYNFSDIMSTGILANYLSNDSVANLMHRGPSAARMTAELKLSDMNDRSWSDIDQDGVTKGRKTVHDFLRTLTKIKADVSSKSEAVQAGEIVSSLASMTKLTKFSVSGIEVGGKNDAVTLYNNLKNNPVIIGLDMIVKPDLISVSTFKAVELTTVVAPSSKDLLFSILSKLGINPYQTLSRIDILVLDTYLSVREMEPDFPVKRSKFLLNLLSYGDKSGLDDNHRLSDLMEVKSDSTGSIGSGSLSLYTAYFYLWNDSELDTVADVMLIDRGRNIASVAHDSNLMNIDTSGSDIRACLEISTKVNFGERVDPKEATNYLIRLARVAAKFY